MNPSLEIWNKTMKKKFLWRIVCFVVLFTITNTVFSATTAINKNLDIIPTTTSSTHTVFAEYAASTGCIPCKNAHAALKSIYTEGSQPFYYVTFSRKNKNTEQRTLIEYNLYGWPTVFFDGGNQSYCGASGDAEHMKQIYITNITQCSGRPVPDLFADLSITWLKNATMRINLTIQNNETTNYGGHLRVYVTEIFSSMWNDSGGNPYTFAFLDYAYNQDIFINTAGIWQESVLWNGHEYNDGYGHNFGQITPDNVMVFATVFNNTRHQGYADLPIGALSPYDAYYVDETTAAMPDVSSNPPSKPVLSGPSSGKAGMTYTWNVVSSEPDNESVYYWVDWGDNSPSQWVGPYPPGIPQPVDHSYSMQGIYSIKAKAKDIYHSQGGWSDVYQVNINESDLAVSNIHGGLMILNALIKNNGNETFTAVQWSIDVKGGILHWINQTTNDVMSSLPAGGSFPVQTKVPLFGFGSITFTFTISSENPSIQIIRTGDGFVFGPFVLIKD
jgi:hypothetical protein